MRWAVTTVITVMVVTTVLIVAPWSGDRDESADSANVALETSSFAMAELDPVVIEEAPKRDPETDAVDGPATEFPPAPENSGAGRRIVFQQSEQRMWLIEADETIERSYLVSGSRFDNLKPGSYAIQSRSRRTNAFDNSGWMEYFLRFATGWSEPIGFHAIPNYHDGTPEQTLDQLGTRLSAGCVRQAMPDAKFLWDWAPNGTPVFVAP